MSNLGNENLKGKNRFEMSAEIRHDSNQIGDQSEQHAQPMNSTLPLMNNHSTKDKGGDFQNDPIPKSGTTLDFEGIGAVAGHSSVINLNNSIAN